ncbi:hypothetical protein JXA85_03235, partial [Candidatus Woesearchaeota archaeon]|nr:hypothetical protein [Candidatus Woesearchaeota archaeon]
AAYIAPTSAPCELFPRIQVDVQKPDAAEFLKKWIKPNQINDTIKTLDSLIELGNRLDGYVRQASIYTAAACGAMYFYTYMSPPLCGPGIDPGTGQEITEGTTEATPGGWRCPQLENLYWVCDRITCPSIPPEEAQLNKRAISDKDGALFTGTFDDNSGKQFDQTVRIIKKEQIDQFVHDTSSRSRIDIEKYYNPALATYDWDDFNSLKRAEIEYRNSHNGEDCNYYVISTITEKQDSEQLRTGEVLPKESRRSYDCINQDNFNDVKDAPNNIGKYTTNIVYKDYGPQFDKMKCLFADGYGTNPTEDIFISTECACLPGVDGHLQGYVMILNAFKTCLQQAYYGENYGGACERIMAQYICEAAQWAIKGVFEGKLPASVSGRSEDELSEEEKKLVKNAESRKTVLNNIKDRYSTIINERTGMSSKRLSTSVCTAALTQNWDFLEGAMNTFVNQINVEPMIHIDASSVPYGYNPLTGKMTIAYNVYVGIIPGGPMEMDLYLECDPFYAKGNTKFCGKGKKTYTAISSKLGRYADKNTGLIDKNIIEIIPDSKWWYNKAVLHVSYKSGTENVDKFYEATIEGDGMIAQECVFDLNNGITCENVYGDGFGAGYVEFTSANSRVSPKKTTIFPGNKASYVLQLNNHYDGNPFYIKATMDGPNTESSKFSRYIIYPIQPANEDEQVYNLLLAKFQGDTQTIYQKFEKEVKFNNWIEFELRGKNIESVDLRIKGVERDADGKVKSNCETGLITFSSTTGGGGSFDLKKEKTEQADKATNAWTKDNNNCDTVNSVEIVSIKDTPGTTGSQEAERLINIRSDDSDQNPSDGNVLYIRPQISSSTPNGKYDVTVQAYEDSASSTPLVYGEKEQKLAGGENYFNFENGKGTSGNIGDTGCSRKPAIDLVEPVGSIVYPEKVPIGMNIVDDCNKIKAIQINIMSADGTTNENYVFVNSNSDVRLDANEKDESKFIEKTKDDEFMKDISKDDFVYGDFEPSTECKIIKNQRVTLSYIGGDNEPPFYQFLWEPEKDTGTYKIIVRAWDYDLEPGTTTETRTPQIHVSEYAIKSQVMLKKDFQHDSAFAFIGRLESGSEVGVEARRICSKKDLQ